MHALAGLVVAGAIAAGAWRAGSLGTGGAVAATLVGGAAMTAGWPWGAVLLAFFVSSSAWSRAGASAKAARTGRVIAKGGPRDAWQVVANGGVFAAAAAGAAWHGALAWSLLGAGALAAATADTWATEIGTWHGGTPRHLITWRPLPVGLSGGVTAVGTAASAIGAAALAAVAVAVGMVPGWAGPAIAGGGVAGALADSLAGALWQERRTCPACGAATERVVHDCGTPTVRSGGWRIIGNDAVNALATAIGGGATMALAHALAPGA
jgi:uncharacterized protein (TIGR00297 family)